MATRLPFARFACLPLLLLAAGCATTGGSSLPSLTDLGGRAQPVKLEGRSKGVVVITLSVDCPLSNKVLPEIQRLEARFGPAGFQFIHLYPNTDETDDAVQAHRREFSPGNTAARDPKGEWTRRFELSVTPQALVVTPDGGLIYRGRIHDQFLSFGTGRPAPTRHDLEEALAEFLDSGNAAGKTTKAIGCRIRIHPESKTR